MIKKHLKAKRILKGFSSREVAEKIGVSERTYSNYENGYINIPISRAVHIAYTLDCGLDEIFPVNELIKEGI